jgi:hypothetical protein
MTKKYTKQQINKKYKGRYIEFIRTYDYTNNQDLYEIIKTSKNVRENMTLGEDVGTSLEFCR